MATTTTKSNEKDAPKADEPKAQQTKVHEPELVPPEVIEEDRIAEVHEKGLIAKYQAGAPDRWKTVLENRRGMLERFRAACIETTAPQDWTLFKDHDGTVIGVPRDSACRRIAKLMGISVFNLRPKPEGSKEFKPEISYEKVEPLKDTEGKIKRDGYTATIVSMIADGYCGVTGETLEDVRNELRSDDKFIGRGHLQDLIQSCRTGLDAKIVRILADMRKVPEDVLKEHNVDTAKAYKGHGYGTSKDRAASKEAGADVKEKAEALRKEIVKRTAGDNEAARALLRDLTKNPHSDPKKNFPGFDSCERFTQEWQLERAWERLRKHEVFGDQQQEEQQQKKAGGGK
jgi:hypothetical protein